VENRINDIDELIGKYLAGETSPEEKLTVDSWRRAHEDNERYFNQFRMIFDQAASVKNTIDVDEDAAWNKLKAKLRGSDEEKVVPLYPQSFSSLFLKIAASIILIMTVGFIAYRYMSPEKIVEVVAEKKTVTDTLPDGSEVVLNKKTQLSYQFDKKKKAHTVKLKGEAFFSIHHEEKKDFVIDVSGVFIRDIGTSFNVKAYPESNTIEVVVEEGEVLFYTETDSGISLHAGGKGVYNKLTKKFSVDTPEKNVTSYKTRVFVFNHTPLGEVVKMLNDVYDENITVSDSVRHCPINVSFDNEDIEEIMGIIADTQTGITVKETESGFSIEGNRCLID
jgi:transmembrane sensor